MTLLEKLEADEKRDEAFLRHITETVDRALATGDTDGFLALQNEFETQERLQIMSRFSELLQLRYLLNAVENERSLGLPLFISGVSSFRQLTDHATCLNQMLRRIEFDIEPCLQDAFEWIKEKQISPYAVSAILYGMTSRLGHREQILLKLSEEALSQERFRDAVGFLSVIENPSKDTRALLDELKNMFMSIPEGGSAP